MLTSQTKNNQTKKKSVLNHDAWILMEKKGFSQELKSER